MSDNDEPIRKKRKKSDELVKDQGKDEALYKKVMLYKARTCELDRNRYPRPGTTMGIARIDGVKDFTDSSEKFCRRCQKKFGMNKEGTFSHTERCNYHKRSLWRNKYQCCGKSAGSKGCRWANSHVHETNKFNRSGYVQTKQKPLPESGNPGIYAVDCEMSFTIDGLELTSVCIVDHNLKVVYKEFVKPNSPVVDYNTEWSGIVERDLRDVTTTLKDVQEFILDELSSDSILIGHSLESDLVALRLIHETIVDTSLVFPHSRGPPFKRALRNLTKDYLGYSIQTGDHDSKEDAMACMKLMLHKVK